MPPVTVTSFFSNPVTSSVNLKKAVNEVSELITEGTPEIVSTGDVLSHTAVSDFCLLGPVLSPSVATSVATDTTTLALSDGVIAIV